MEETMTNNEDKIQEHNMFVRAIIETQQQQEIYERRKKKQQEQEAKQKARGGSRQVKTTVK
jgi:hypothetical protein